MNYEDLIEPNEFLYTAAEICRNIHVTRKTWQKWTEQAEIKGRGNGKALLYTIGDIYKTIRLIYGDTATNDIIEHWLEY